MNKPQMQRTKNNYDVYECVSSLQKYIRRSMEEEAMYVAFEIESVGWMSTVISRLRVMSQEDIGIADREAVVFALHSLELTENWYKTKNGAWKLGLANAIISLCRAKKSRLADNFQAHIEKMRSEKRIELIDCGIDKHTRRGKAMGRGMGHFLQEGATLIDFADSQSDLKQREERYEKNAHSYWLKGSTLEDLFHGESEE